MSWVIGGDTGLGGAAAMAAEAALRTGAGLVSVATRPEHVSAILARRPETDGKRGFFRAGTESVIRISHRVGGGARAWPVPPGQNKCFSRL